MWTWITAAAYGFVGIGAAWFFNKRKSNAKNYAIYAVIGTLAYDAATFKNWIADAFPYES